MTSKLNNLSDPLARSLCAYLDPASLGQLAGANKKFHLLSSLADSDAGKIQALVQKHRLRDLGLRVAYPEDEQQRCAGFIDAGSQHWIFNRYVSRKNELILSQNGLFTSHSLQLQERYINGSSRYLFTEKEKSLQVRDPQGSLLTSIPAPKLVKAFELPFRQDQQLVLLVMEDKLEVWNLAQKENAAPILAHPVPRDREINTAERFDNVLVLHCWMHTTLGAKTLLVYDMNDLEKHPQEVVHPRYSAFSAVMETCHNDSQLFLASGQNTVSLLPHSGNFAWEISEMTRYTHFAHANEKWLVLFNRPPAISSFDESQMAYIEIRDAKTGAFCGKFFMPYELRSLNEYDFTLWGSSILVAKKEDTLLFWSLPEGRKLPSWKLENCKIRQVIVSGKQLLVHYEDKNSGQYRVISWNTPPCSEETNAPNDLPKLTLNQPERKKVSEASLCDRIYACVQDIFAWLASLFRWLTNIG